jgi:hypothetical protein
MLNRHIAPCRVETDSAAVLSHNPRASGLVQRRQEGPVDEAVGNGEGGRRRCPEAEIS